MRAVCGPDWPDGVARRVGVTGGGSGIGPASALELSAGGWCVAVCGRWPEVLEAVVAQPVA